MYDPAEPDVERERAGLPEGRHFFTDFDVTSKLVTTDRCLMVAPVTAGVCSAAGSASVGMLMTMVDVASSEPALATCRTDWTATQDLSLHAADWLTDGPVVVDSRLARVGKKVIMVATDIYDGHGNDDLEALQLAVDGLRASGVTTGPTLAAKGLLTFARIPREAASGMDDYDPSDWIGEIRRRSIGPPPEGTMYERLGFRVVDPAAGVVELDRTAYVTNSIGTINGGSLAVLIEVAAEALRPELVATDMQIHYLSQVKVGPARTIGTVSRSTADHSVVTVDVVDAGHGDQVLALATVTLQRPPG